MDVGITQTYSVLEICKVYYHKKMQKSKGRRWGYDQTVSLKFATSTIQRYKHSRVDVGVTSLRCNLKFAKSTLQRYITSRVDAGATNLQCP